MREYKGAILDFSKAIAMDDTEETFFKNRAETYEEVHDYRNAMHDYETLIRKNPRVYSYRCDKANLLNKQGKTELALTELDEVLKITPGESSAYLTRAPIQFRKAALREYADDMIMGSTLRSLDDSAH